MATFPEHQPVPARPLAGPLWPVLAFTALGSLGTGAVTNGVYFLTDSAFAFTRRENYLLGAAFGVAYIAGAAALGRLLTPMLERRAWLSGRMVLFALSLGLMAAAALPGVTAALIGSTPPEWTVWVAALVYAPVSGALWPVVEHYLAGGRRGPRLRRATGLFNVAWSAALVAAFAGMAPLRSMGRPLDTLTALSAVHLVSCGLLVWFTPRPAPHLPDEHEPHPPVYLDLLVVFRWLLPMSYLVLSTLTPYLPSALAKAGVGAGWAVVAAGTWMAARVGTFVVFQSWDGWHGRWWTPILGVVGLLIGFGACLLAPLTGDGALVTLLAGLAVFGASQGMIYLGALYYVMETVDDGSEAGATHEALIGVGYAAGPLVGLAAGVALGPGHPLFEPVVLGVVLLVALGVASLVAGEIRTRSYRGHGDSDR